MKVYKESESQIVFLSRRGGGGGGEGSIPLHQVIEIFFQQSSTVLLTHLLFSTLILPVVIYKN